MAVGDEQQCQATCRGKAWRIAMERGMQNISLDLVLTQLYDRNGGGRTCTNIQWSFAITVASVLLWQE